MKDVRFATKHNGFNWVTKIFVNGVYGGFIILTCGRHVIVDRSLNQRGERSTLTEAREFVRELVTQKNG